MTSPFAPLVGLPTNATSVADSKNRHVCSDWLMARSSIGRVERFFVHFGRTSLFTYVVQYYVVQTLPWLLRWRHRMRPWQIVVYLAVALPVMNIASTALERYKSGNQPRPYPGAKPG